MRLPLLLSGVSDRKDYTVSCYQVLVRPHYKKVETFVFRGNKIQNETKSGERNWVYCCLFKTVFFVKRYLLIKHFYLIETETQKRR